MAPLRRSASLFPSLGERIASRVRHLSFAFFSQR